jgi:hypothetical protein
MLGSNQRPPPCRGGALPAELIARGGPRLPTAPLALTVVRGDVAEWLRSGLQSRLHRFDSGRRLSAKPLLMRGSQRSFPHCALLGEPAPPADTSPATSIARFIGEVTAVDAGAGSVALHVVTVENLPGDQSEDDSTATTSLSPSSQRDVRGHTRRHRRRRRQPRRHRGGRPRQGRRRGERLTPGWARP